ncbi:MAG: O-antigen ligase family protein [Chloroflexi bacterium]|nr:O-antigen ligase family protein [Chloroflexota bacterium]
MLQLVPTDRSEPERIGLAPIATAAFVTLSLAVYTAFVALWGSDPAVVALAAVPLVALVLIRTDRSGSRPKTSLPFHTAVLATSISVLYAALLIRLQGDPGALVAAAIPFVAVFLLMKPLYALYAAIGVALLVDDELTPWLEWHRGVGELSGHTLDWLVLSPLELLILAAVLGHLVKAMRAKEAPFRPGAFLWPMLPFLAFVIAGFVVGRLQGGDARMAIFELRAILYMPAIYLVFCNTVKTKRQLHMVMWITLLAIGLDALLTLWTYFVNFGGDLKGRSAITDHQVAIFFAALVVFGFVHWLYRGRPGAEEKRGTSPRTTSSESGGQAPALRDGGFREARWQGLVMLTILPLITTALIAANRRAAYVALAIGIVVVLAVAFRDHKRVVVKIALAVAILSMVYAGAFWNSKSFLAKPLQGFKSVNAEEGTRDFSSNFYRVQEKWNISITLRHNPLLGVGFGKPFEMAIPLPWFNSPLREYVTHNSVVWIWLKTGVAGFLAFLTFIGLAVARAARIYRQVEDWQLKPMLATGLAFIIMYEVYSYVDQGWDFKGMVFIGTILGCFAVVERMKLLADGSGAKANV